MKSGCCPSRSFSAFSRIVLANPVKKKLKVFLFFLPSGSELIGHQSVVPGGEGYVHITIN
jgi:hypothetical protein